MTQDVLELVLESRSAFTLEGDDAVVKRQRDAQEFPRLAASYEGPSRGRYHQEAPKNIIMFLSEYFEFRKLQLLPNIVYQP